MNNTRLSCTRRLAGFTSFCASVALALGLLLPTGGHAATYAANATLTLEAVTTAHWTPTPSTYPPGSSDGNTWQTGAFKLVNNTVNTVFNGNLLEIVNGGTFQSGVASDIIAFQNIQL